MAGVVQSDTVKPGPASKLPPRVSHGVRNQRTPVMASEHEITASGLGQTQGMPLGLDFIPMTAKDQGRRRR